MGRSTGSIKVFSRLKTRAMKTPMGLVTARTSPKKTAICSHPFAVMSEFLRPQQRIEQVHHHQSAYCEHDCRFQVHSLLISLLFFAKANVANRHDEEQHGYRDENNVLHMPLRKATDEIVSRTSISLPELQGFVSASCEPRPD